MNFEATYENYKKMIDNELDGHFVPGGFPFDGLVKSMRYSLLAGGKRLRPILTLEFCRATGGDIESAMPAACAVEMMHTYSLIHDDLPCMDDDDTRRGKPSNHKVYNEAVATLAGDALQAEAFSLILSSPLSDSQRANCAMYLASAAGIDGICGGQYMDMHPSTDDLQAEDRVFELCGRKTGSLLSAACMMGVAVAGGTEEQCDCAGRFGAALGLAFQAVDDMLDVTGSESDLGKPTGSDETASKQTIMSLLGEAECRDFIEQMTIAAKATVNEEFKDSEFLCALADSLASRTK